MQLLGLVGVVVTVTLIGWWFVSVDRTSLSQEGGEMTTKIDSYGDAIDSANEAVDQIEGRDIIFGKTISVYDDVEVAQNIKQLDLSGRGLEGSLKAEIRHLTKLTVLDMSNNDFTGLPAEVGQLTQLEVLNLSDNPFTGLPHELGNLKNLQTLDLRGTQYSGFDLDVIKAGLPDTVEILTN